MGRRRRRRLQRGRGRQRRGERDAAEHCAHEAHVFAPLLQWCCLAELQSCASYEHHETLRTIASNLKSIRAHLDAAVWCACKQAQAEHTQHATQRQKLALVPHGRYNRQSSKQQSRVARPRSTFRPARARRQSSPLCERWTTAAKAAPNATMDSDDELPPLESDTHVAPVHYSRRSLLALTSPEEPAAAKRPEQPSALAVAAAKRSLDAPKNGASGGGEATTGGASPKKEAALWQAADLTCRSTVKGVRRRKPRPRPPATLIKKERHACGYASAPDEPSNGTEQRRRSLEYQTPPATPVQYDSEDDFFSPKKFREPEDFEHPCLPDEEDRPRPRLPRPVDRNSFRICPGAEARPERSDATATRRRDGRETATTSTKVADTTPT